jgi:hypothetical protein
VERSTSADRLIRSQLRLTIHYECDAIRKEEKYAVGFLLSRAASARGAASALQVNRSRRAPSLSLTITVPCYVLYYFSGRVATPYAYTAPAASLQ